MSTCTRCGGEIRWVRTARNDKLMPLDPEPTVLGTVVLRDDDGRAVVLDIPARDAGVVAGWAVYRPHFASCPARTRHVA